MKNAINEIKKENKLEGSYSSLVNTEECISNLQDIVMEITQQKEKQIKKREPSTGPVKHQVRQGSHYRGSRKRREREKESKMYQ